MSETQRRVTGTFQAVDDAGGEYHVVEYTDFRHTTTAEITYGDDGTKEYELASGKPLKRISETQFEIEAEGLRIRRKI
ncbi:MAG: hypothetical protein M3033_03945 [Acidobacteriota bacterium]|nr:hypothetical protein [Acidobacteriota bacterium]